MPKPNKIETAEAVHERTGKKALAMGWGAIGGKEGHVTIIDTKVVSSKAKQKKERRLYEQKT